MNTSIVESSHTWDTEHLVSYNAPHAEPQETVLNFINGQRINTYRDIVALRSFYLHEFGKDAASPSPAHIRAANQLIKRLQSGLFARHRQMSRLSVQASYGYQQDDLAEMLRLKEVIGIHVKRLEGIWQFYLALFGQRTTEFAYMLLATDRIALDCYQATYTGLDIVRSIPSPAPFSYMETGHTPATFRRGVLLTKLSKQPNPFPIVSLPYNRLNNPWTLGAVHHEVAHNIQSDLKLWEIVPKRIFASLSDDGIPERVARIWQGWHKEIWADLCGLLLGGPGIVVSLLDVLARTSRSTAGFHAGGVHPTPLLRAEINFHLLERMGFAQDATRLRHLWRQLYSSRVQYNIPKPVLQTFRQAMERVVEVIIFAPYPQLGDKSLQEVIPYKSTYVEMTSEAAKRLAHGVDPGIIPERFLVGAARIALEEKLASPANVKRNFYRALSN